MKYAPDAYLLHEANSFITFNIRIKVIMKDPVNPVTLKTAAQKAFARFPYYAKQIHVDEDGGIDLIPNPRPICVSPVSSKKLTCFLNRSTTSPVASNTKIAASISICITECVVAAAHSYG